MCITMNEGKQFGNTFQSISLKWGADCIPNICIVNCSQTASVSGMVTIGTHQCLIRTGAMKHRTGLTNRTGRKLPQRHPK